jgi:hypothetical protein
MRSTRSSRVRALIDSARQNPELLLHVSPNLQASARRELGAALAQRPQPQAVPAEGKPGLKKCAPRLTPMSVQLYLFAKSTQTG